MKNIGIAPLYHNAYVTVKGVRSKTSLKGLLPGEEATYTVAGLEISDSESPEVTITGDKLLKDATIPYKASLDGSAEVIGGLVDESGTTAIAGGRILTPGKDAADKVTNKLSKSRVSKLTDLKGRIQNHPQNPSHKVYFKVKKN